MGNDEERTGGTVGSDQIDTGSKGDAQETAFDATPAQVDTKKKKKKDLGIGTSRGIETMFRTSYRVHQDLVGIADAKANIMISVNG